MSTIGLLIPFAGTDEPEGWLFCDGREVSRRTYHRLYELYQDTYGAGDGIDTFNLPDLRGRVIVGANNSLLPNGLRTSFSTSDPYNTLSVRNNGDTGGAETHVVTIPELHTHGQTHAGPTTSSTGDHNHNYSIATGSGGTGGSVSPSAPTTTGAAGDHEHTFTTDPTGGDQPHNNIQPFITLNYIVKAK